jgi:hypothetical protein
MCDVTIADMVLAYLKVFIWPVVAMVGIWLLRDRLGSISRVETPVGAVDFAAEARQAHEQIANETDPAARPVTQGADAFSFAALFVEENPLDAVLAAGLSLEASYRYALIIAKPEATKEAVLESLTRLRSLRENALRDRGAVTATAAREFVEASKLTAVHLGIGWFPGPLHASAE